MQCLPRLLVHPQGSVTLCFYGVGRSGHVACCTLGVLHFFSCFVHHILRSNLDSGYSRHPV